MNASHTLAYSLIALQEMNLAYKYPIIFWDCACLIVNAGGEQTTEDTNNSKDYNKIAQALSKAISSGINILPPDINKSDFTFTPVPENNSIVYGLSGINKIGLNLIPSIINNRPYNSFMDFLSRTNLNKAQIIELIKAGAFNSFDSQPTIMIQYLWLTCDKKKRLTLQNMPGLIKYNLIPKDNEFKKSFKVYEFNRYLKDYCKGNNIYYKLDDRAITFLEQLDESVDFTSEGQLNIKAWDKIYQKYMDMYRDWIKENKEQVLDQLNTAIFMQDWNKYAQGNISSWEMEAICYYCHDHELAHINNQTYNLSNFNQLPEIPVVDKIFHKANRDIPLFKINRIAGTVVAKNKAKYVVYLLTTNGIVPIKFRKEYFVLFDRQISQKDQDNKKHVIEKSWFSRGDMLIIQGFRRDNEFIARKYASTQGHTMYHIDKVNKDGTLILRSERAKGEIEDEV